MAQHPPPEMVKIDRSCLPFTHFDPEILFPCHSGAVNTELCVTSRVRYHLPRSKCIELRLAVDSSPT